MSRIGKVPIAIPGGVTVETGAEQVRVKGPKGELEMRLPGHIRVTQDTALHVQRPGDDKQSRAFHGLVHRLLTNMITGVTQGFTRQLEIVGVGYRAAASSPAQLDLHLGFSHPVSYPAPSGIEFTTPTPTSIVIKGIDKQKVGQVAAELRALRPPEPYKGKGVRYQGEQVRRKVGKAGAK